MTKAVYAFRDDSDFMITFMGILPPDYPSVAPWVEKLDDEEKWPESHYALYIDLETLNVFILEEGYEGETIGKLCNLISYNILFRKPNTELLENALKEYFSWKNIL